MHHPPTPDTRSLLPPLLACLPTAFLAPRPPPALLPLLSPVLRQRLNFLTATNTQGPNGWLPLLAWDTQRAAKLPSIVETMELEPHPVSGEMEVDDVRAIKYRRLDEETLQSRLEVEQFGLLPVYVWCAEDEHGGTGPGWKMAELRSLEDAEEDETEWYETQLEANDVASSSTSTTTAPAQSQSQQQASLTAEDDDDEDDASYWAQYDATPGPSQKPSPAPPNQRTFPSTNSTTTTTARPGLSAQEAEYFARYGDEVQPALDSHDPDEEAPEINGQSTLQGSSQRQRALQDQHHDETSKPHDSAISSLTHSITHTHAPSEAIPAPRPLSPESSPNSRTSSVDKLEEQARSMSRSDAEERAERGVRQHISTDVKSLFRLARGVGMSRGEFEACVQRELAVLGMLEEE
ncbi:hypothetical protein MBLNU230_g5718t1 [Neophaeotheca triangularis]